MPSHLTPPIPENETRENAMFFPDSRCSLWRTEPYCFWLLLATSPAPVRTFQYSICFKLLFYLVEQMRWFPSRISLQVQYSFATTTLTLDVIQSLSHFSTTDPVQILACINRDNQRRKDEFAALGKQEGYKLFPWQIVTFITWNSLV